MKLDVLQTRGMYLAGTVPFPKGFPTAAPITIEQGAMYHASDDPRDDFFVVLIERSSLYRLERRVARLENVAAIFFPGVWTKEGGKNVFVFAEADAVDDLDKGEWFLKPDVDPKKISQKLRIDITSSDSGAMGIVFVPSHLPVATIEEYVSPASIFSEDEEGCDG